MHINLKRFAISLSIISLFILFPTTRADAANVQHDDRLTNRPMLTFGVISDIHLRAGRSDWGSLYHDYRAEKKFATALQELQLIDADLNALVINGDLTVTGLQSDYDSMNRVLHHTPHPRNTLFAIGNHEFHSAFRNSQGLFSIKTFPNHVTENMCIRRFLHNTGMPNLYYEKWILGYQFIVLGSEQSRITHFSNGENAVLSDRQLHWLNERLKENGTSKPVFVFLHQPIPYTVAGSNGNYIVQADKLRNILNHYPQVIFFSGHSHLTVNNQPRTMYQSVFTMFNDSSVRNPIASNHTLVGDSEGLYVQVYKDKVIVRARDFTHKLWIGRYIVPVHSNGYASSCEVAL